MENKFLMYYSLAQALNIIIVGIGSCRVTLFLYFSHGIALAAKCGINVAFFWYTFSTKYLSAAAALSCWAVFRLPNPPASLGLPGHVCWRHSRLHSLPGELSWLFTFRLGHFYWEPVHVVAKTLHVSSARLVNVNLKKLKILSIPVWGIPNAGFSLAYIMNLCYFNFVDS